MTKNKPKHKNQFCEKFVRFFKIITRKKKLEPQIFKGQYESVRTDYNVAECILYYLLGSTCDFVLDLVYSKQNTSATTNPLFALALSLVFFALPSILIFLEIAGATPGQASLYSYCYVGIGEIWAVWVGNIVYGIAMSRITLMFSFILPIICGYLKKIINETFLSVWLVIVVMLFLPFTGTQLGISLIRVGMFLRLLVSIFFFRHVDVDNFHRLPYTFDSTTNLFDSFLQMLSFCNIFFAIPLIPVCLSPCYRRKLLISKMLRIYFCVLAFIIFFFVVLVGNEPFYSSTDYWLLKLMGRYRPSPYLLIFVLPSFITMYCGVYSVIETSSIVLYQMSVDGLAFKFLQSSKRSRNVWLFTHFIYVIMWGTDKAFYFYSIVGSLGTLFAGLSLLYLRVYGAKDFYIPYAVMCKDEKEHKLHRFFGKGSKYIFLIFILGLMLYLIAFTRIVYYGLSISSSFLVLFYVSLAMLICSVIFLTIGARYRSVCTPFHCPLAPLAAFSVIIISVMNIAVQAPNMYLTFHLIAYTFIFYLWFGIKSASITLSGNDIKPMQDMQDKCNEGLREDRKLYNILNDYLEETQAEYAPNKREACFSSEISTKANNTGTKESETLPMNPKKETTTNLTTKPQQQTLKQRSKKHSPQPTTSKDDPNYKCCCDKSN